MIKKRDDVDGRANCEQKLELVNGVFVVASKAQAPDLEKRFQIEEYREHDLQVIIGVVIGNFRSFDIREIHRRRCDTVGQNGEHDEHAEMRRPQDRVAQGRRWTAMFVLVQSYQFPSVVVPDQYLNENCQKFAFGEASGVDVPATRNCCLCAHARPTFAETAPESR